MARATKNKENTKKRLIAAVGQLFKTEGYAGLGVNKVAKLAGVHKKLIYRYFGNFESLVEAYVIETDFWLTFANQLKGYTELADADRIQEIIAQILIKQYEYFRDNFETQELILWELSTNSRLMNSIHRTREIMGEQLLTKADPLWNSDRVNFRAVAALLVGGIYYTVLHTRHNGGKFTGIDLNSEEGEADFKKAIEFVLSSGFKPSSRS